MARLRRGLLKPVCEIFRANAGTRTGNEAFVVEFGAEVAGMSVGDHFTLIFIGAEHTADQDAWGPSPSGCH